MKYQELYNKLCLDKTGHSSRIKNFKKNHFNIYKELCEHSEINKFSDLPFSERLYLFFNNMSVRPVCLTCESPVKYQGKVKGYLTYCSKKCANNSSIVKNKIKYNREQTNLKRYGNKIASKNKDVRNKISETYSNKTKEEKTNINNKRINTVLTKYNVDSVSKVKEIQEQRIKSFKKNIIKWKKSYTETSLKKYGTRHPWQSEKIKNKQKTTMINKYGVDNFSKSKELRDSALIKRYKKDIKGFKKLLPNNYIKVQCETCEKEYKIKAHLYARRIRFNMIPCTLCNPTDSNIKSSAETQIIDFINSNYTKKVISNNRKILNGKELDIYIPDLKLGIEFNGLYWHSELFKDKDYHLEKTELANLKDINLMHIWEDDWLYKQDIVKSMILNKLGKSEHIYARKCEIREVNSKESSKFLEENHLQGRVNSKIKLGLYYNGELVSLMTFGGLRRALGSKSKEGHYELLRFCNKLNTSVVGGASRLFKRFLRDYEPAEVLSYANRDWATGNLYRNLGFEFDSYTRPGYSYIVNGIRENRFKYRKSKLIKEGYDEVKSEHQIMSEKGLYRIYDTGNLIFRFKLIV